VEFPPTLPESLQRNLLSPPPADEPAWRSNLRVAGFEAWQRTGLPTRHSEMWRHTDLAPLQYRAKISAWPTEPPAGELFDGARLIGRTLDGAASPASELPAGVACSATPFAQGPWSIEALGELDGYAALVLGCAVQGMHLRIDANADVAGPLLVLHEQSAADGWMPALNTIHVGRHARATLIEIVRGEPGQEGVRMPLTLVRLDDGAQLHHVRLQWASVRSTVLCDTRASLGRDAALHDFVWQRGALLGRDNFEVRVDGPGAHASLAALYTPSANQTLDHHTLIDHTVPDAGSHQHYKGIVGAGGQAVFNGRIQVKRAAQRTAAEQLNQTLLLSRTSKVHAKPQLEIFADDVKCTHGATVGQLNAEELFYLQTRAIDPQTARAMVTAGFALDVLEQVADASVRAWLVHQVERHVRSMAASGE
jgi:Fe-S cluster assembly protein SufD